MTFTVKLCRTELLNDENKKNACVMFNDELKLMCFFRDKTTFFMSGFLKLKSILFFD